MGILDRPEDEEEEEVVQFATESATENRKTSKKEDELSQSNRSVSSGRVSNAPRD